MISVIIPTLWRSNLIEELVNQLDKLDLIGEIIIIDNDTEKSIDLKSDKIIYVKNESNNYVNPSWNQGVKVAKYELLCLMNDDIIISDDVFHFIDNFLKLEHGIVGLSENVYVNINKELQENITIQQTSYRNFGFGCCIFLYKNNYNWIPEQLKVMYGDDWLFYAGDKPNFVLDGIKIKGKIASSKDGTIDEKKLYSISIDDYENFWNLVDKYIFDKPIDSSFGGMKRSHLSYYRTIDNKEKYIR